MIKKINAGIIDYDAKVQSWCLLPYPKHPSGCPNYDKHRSLRGIRPDIRPRVIRECPPTNILLDKIFDLSKDIYIIYNVYPVGLDADNRMKTNTKLKTNAEFYNIRYWQDRARRQLYDEVTIFLDSNPDTIADLCPETHGVNHVKLMSNMGIKLEWGAWPPEHSIDNVVYQICMGGFPSNKEFLIEEKILGRTE
jgi:hypothetical protein